MLNQWYHKINVYRWNINPWTTTSTVNHHGPPLAPSLEVVFGDDNSIFLYLSSFFSLSPSKEVLPPPFFFSSTFFFLLFASINSIHQISSTKPKNHFSSPLFLASCLSPQRKITCFTTTRFSMAMPKMHLNHLNHKSPLWTHLNHMNHNWEPPPQTQPITNHQPESAVDPRPKPPWHQIHTSSLPLPIIS